MRADDDVGPAVGGGGVDALFWRTVGEPAGGRREGALLEPSGANMPSKGTSPPLKQRREVRVVLFGEDLGGASGGLPPGGDGGEHGRESDDGLATADVSLQETEHGRVLGDVGKDLVEGAALGGCEAEG